MGSNRRCKQSQLHDMAVQEQVVKIPSSMITKQAGGIKRNIFLAEVISSWQDVLGKSPHEVPYLVWNRSFPNCILEFIQGRCRGFRLLSCCCITQAKVGRSLSVDTILLPMPHNSVLRKSHRYRNIKNLQGFVMTESLENQITLPLLGVTVNEFLHSSKRIKDSIGTKNLEICLLWEPTIFPNLDFTTIPNLPSCTLLHSLFTTQNTSRCITRLKTNFCLHKRASRKIPAFELSFN